MDKVEQFYNQLSSQYSELIAKCFPRYPEWMAHQDAHDFHTPVSWHLRQLEKAGFAETDILWKYLLWAVIWARK